MYKCPFSHSLPISAEELFCVCVCLVFFFNCSIGFFAFGVGGNKALFAKEMEGSVSSSL